MRSGDTFAPGNVVVVRDEEWVVTSIDESADGQGLNAQDPSALAEGRTWKVARRDRRDN